MKIHFVFAHLNLNIIIQIKHQKNIRFMDIMLVKKRQLIFEC